MEPNISPIPQPKPETQTLPVLFEALGISNITPQDQFSIEYARGFLTATVKRDTGAVEVVRKHFSGGFTQSTSFDPDSMSRDDRNEVIHTLRDDGLSQSEISRRIGFSQATVSNVLRKPKA